MTAKVRDRNLARVRHVTAVIAGASLVACGIFAGLAASVTQHVFAAKATTAAKQVSTTKKTTATRALATRVTPAVVVTPAAPVSTSGGS